ncbi:DNRLRE domain-containing protein [archaeon]|nr:DNRLRE domain-containing protein [archaeon]
MKKLLLLLVFFCMGQLVYAAAPTLEVILSPQNLTEGVAYSYMVNASDPEAGDITFSDNTDNFDIVAINGTHAQISFTPTNAMVGSFIAVIIAIDEEFLVDAQAVNFTVNGLPIISTTDKNVTAGNQFEYDIHASDPEEGIDGVNYTDDSALFVINFTTGLINFTTTLGDVGDYIVTITVNDSLNEYATSLFNLAINDWPNASSIPVGNATEDASFNLNISDYINNTVGSLTFYDNSSLFNIGNDTGIISFTPDNESIGNHSINITVVDQYGLSDSLLNWTLRITAVNDCPIFPSIPNQSVIVGLWFEYDVNATDEEGDTIYYYDNSPFFVINESTGLINFSVNSSMMGVNIINITVNDTNSGNHTGIFALNVTANNPPGFVKNFTLNITPSIDTYVDSQFGDSNYRGSNVLGVSDVIGSIKRIYINFSLNSIPNDAQILLSSLNLTVSSALVGYNVSLFGINGSWNGSNITYNNQLSINESPISNSSSAAAEGIDGFNITYFVKNWYNGSINNSGFSLRMENESANSGTIDYYSSDSSNSSKYPFLYVVYNQTIPNQTLDVSTNLSNVFDLDDYFYDLDGHSLNYTTTSSPSNTNIAIASDNQVTIVAGATAGEDIIIFNATDGLNTTLSNSVKIIVVAAADSPITSGSSGGSSSRTRVASMVINLNSERETYNQGDIFQLPLTVENTGQRVISAIDIISVSNEVGLILSIPNNYIDSLVVGGTFDTILIVDSSNVEADTYVITISAAGQTPQVNASSFFVLDLLGEGGQIKEELLMAQDLFQQNPECLELQELVNQAEVLLAEGKYEEARADIALAIESCKNMIRTSTSPFKSPGGFFSLEIVLLALTILTVSIIVIYTIFTRVKYLKKR